MFKKYKLSVQQILRNVAQIFITLEQQENIVYREKMPELDFYLKKIYLDLNQEKECVFLTPDKTMHYLKLQENPI